MQKDTALALYGQMLATRKLDELEASLAQRGEVFFYLPSTGHEALAALQGHLVPEDWLFCHYRDKALAHARGVSLETLLCNVLAKASSDSKGRRMPGFPNDARLHMVSTPTLVANNALQAVGVAMQIKEQSGQPVVYCSLGDGSTQQGEFYEAVAESVRSELPVLFVVQDNRFALSTPTRERTFYSMPGCDPDRFHGVPITHIAAHDVCEVYEKGGRLIEQMRHDRHPQIVIAHVERLSSHTNADDQTVYRSEREIQEVRERADPVALLRLRLLEVGVAETELQQLESDTEAELNQALDRARLCAEPVPAPSAKRPLDDSLTDPSVEYTGRKDEASLNMVEAMREVLRCHLKKDESVTLYGEDIEDPKGDVFGLTRSLSTEFPGRVVNAPLSESTILGTSIGRALAGGRPVAMIQFADFLPLAYNQILSELGAMYWRSGEQWECPVIVMAICGAYRPGLGPYHAQSPESVMAHVPGVDVFMPSSAMDAAGMLNAAFASGRPSIFFYPKSLINERVRMTSTDVEKQRVPIGRARVEREGGDITIVSWGSTLPLCGKVAEALELAVGLYAEVIDLRSLFPWDIDTVLASVEKTGRLLVVHEDNQTCGLGGEVVAAITEKRPGVRVARATRTDTYVPYHFGNQLAVMPSFKSIMEKAAELVEYDLEWEEPVKLDADRLMINVMGSSPSDENVKIVDIHVREGQHLEEGALIASVEADKAAMDISAPRSGTVEKIYLEEGAEADVGQPFVAMKTDADVGIRPLTTEEVNRPLLTKRRKPLSAENEKGDRCAGRPVYLNSISTCVGSKLMTNDEFLNEFPGWDSDDVKKRTGIEKRYWMAEGESVLTLAARACRDLLERERLKVSDLDMIICSTGTPDGCMTPSLSCKILKELSADHGEVMVQAYDINAACTGFLYALQAAYDTLKYDASRKIMVVTAEGLSRSINLKDPGTAFIFGDAATASLLTCERRDGNMHARVHRPVLSAMGVDEHILRVPFPGSGEFINMEGQQVFKVAVRKMVDMLDKACRAENVTVDQLDMIVTHQANERIIEAARKMIKFPKEKVFNQMRDYGNTSSNTIPIALTTVIPNMKSDEKVGLSAFGGGYTFGGAVLEVL